MCALPSGVSTDRERAADLSDLKEMVLHLGAHAEDALVLAVRALSTTVEPDAAMRAHQAARRAADLVGRLDEHCLRVLALRQPLASDLRCVTSTLKITVDLEQVAELSSGIALDVAQLRPSQVAPELLRKLVCLAAPVRAMLRDALDAFVDADVLRAEDVVARDSAVDEMYVRLLSELFGLMSNQAMVSTAFHLSNIARNLERIADHATNIGEMVVFMVHGEDVRHAPYGDDGRPVSILRS